MEAYKCVNVLWKIDPDNVHTPPKADIGPNQILLRKEYFRNGFIQAVVQPIALQPYLQPGKKTKMECGLVGRFQNADNYIAAGLGVHGHDIGLTEVVGGRFTLLWKRDFDLGHEVRLRLDFKDNEVTLSYGDLSATARTGIRAGHCGLRADWTEAHFKDIKAEPHDTDCFVIGPIGEVSSLTRERSDRLLETLIRPTLAAHGYHAWRAEEFTTSGNIKHEIFQHLVDDELVIADLSEHNPNVYYELAIRHAARKPFIHIIQGGDKLPFDVHDLNTIRVNVGSDDSLRQAIHKLDRLVSSLKPDAQVMTPVPNGWKLVRTKQAIKGAPTNDPRRKRAKDG